MLLAGFWYLVTKTALGRAQRACEQDQKMAALLGVDVDRTISITFVIGAALAAVAGTMYLMYYGVVSFSDGFVPGVKAFTAAVLGGIGSLPGAVIGGLLIGLIETMWSAYFSIDYKDVAAFSILAIMLIFLPQGMLGRPKSRRCEHDARRRPTPPCRAPSAPASTSLRCASRTPPSPALIAFGLFLPLIGFTTVQNMRNELVARDALAAAARRDRRASSSAAQLFALRWSIAAVARTARRRAARRQRAPDGLAATRVRDMVRARSRSASWSSIRSSSMLLVRLSAAR